MTQRLPGKIAIVTGASRGIGEAMARTFVAAGATVVIVSRKQEGLDRVAESINSEKPGSVLAKSCHMGEPEQIQALLEFVANEVGVADVLVNNAATNPFFGPMTLIEPRAYDKTFEVNLRGAFELARSVAQAMMSAGKGGSIINVASIAGLGAAPFQGVYGMTKAALISMTQTLALELGGAGIRVNAIAPGLVDTKLASALVGNPELAKRYTDRAALGRVGQPIEIAGPALFLASDESSYVTGHTLVADGGYVMAS